MSDNWIVQNLNSALQTWSDKLAEIWTLLTQSPENFKGGAIWSVMTNINGGLRAIGYGLLVLFFAAGLVKTCGSFTDMKKPEHVVKAFIRFALAQGAVMSGMELLTAIFSIVQGIVANIMSHSGMAGGTVTELPSEIVDKIEAVGMLESIPLWIVTLLGSLLITVLSFVMILTVYGRIVFDEPTSGLDYRHMKKVAENLRELSSLGKTLFIVTHDPELIAECCNYFVFIENGKVLWSDGWNRISRERLQKFFAFEDD